MYLIKKFKIPIIIFIIFTSFLLLIIFYNKNYILQKGWQYYPNLMEKIRYVYFNLPHNLVFIPTSDPIEHDLDIKNKLSLLKFTAAYSKEINFFNINKKVDFYMPRKNILLSGISNKYAGSSYLDYFDNNLFLLSARGIIAYGQIDKNEINLKQIKNNLNNFLGKDKFIIDRSYSFKDLLIFNNKLFVSFTDEIKDDCWGISVLQSELSLDYLEFKFLFRENECIDENNDEGFVSIQTGGRIFGFNNNEILLTTGEYRFRKKAQDPASIFGKIIKINLENNKYKIVSMGHRNPQGLYVDEENKIVLSTEHGPRGGDEINLLNFDSIKKNIIPNFGWPISSYGEHYAKKDKNIAINKDKQNEIDLLYKKYPLYKSHKQKGFVEPIYTFTPSIGISEIVGLGNSRYMSSSLGGKKLFFFKLNKENIDFSYDFNFGERIRDVIYKDNKLIFFMEDTSTIAVVNF